MIVFKSVLTTVLILGCFACVAAQETKPKTEFEYKLLATSRTTTMEKEMNEAAAEGYRFTEVISGNTVFGGAETLVLMNRSKSTHQKSRFEYKLLATKKTSTMQKELQAAGDAGFEHCGQSVFESEVVVILQRDRQAKPQSWDYKLIATTKTSTMEKEVMEAAAEGYQFVAFSTGSTFFGGNEVVTIMRRLRAEVASH